jgi:hypothetical protein
MPGDHARLSPSAAERWFACPGAPNAEAGLPESTSPAASEGTRAHTILEQALTERKPVKHFRGQADDDEMLRHVGAAWALILGYQGSTGSLTIEVKTDAGESMGRDDLYGTADAVIWHGSHLTVLDLKYGVWPVSPVANKQLQIYAVGAAAQAAKTVETITLGIIQPRTDGPPLKLHTMTRAELVLFAHELKQAASATDSQDPPRNPGDHCRFCRAASQCPTLAQGGMI